MEILYILDLVGTFVFAISGTLTAADKRLDLMGATVIGFVTAIGGGTVRDLLLGIHPVGWMQDVNYLWVILAGVVCTVLFKGNVLKLKRTLSLFDTIGIGVFTVLGLSKALMAGVEPVFAVMMGTISAVFGGVIRDTLCNDIPIIFRPTELYATVCLSGGCVFLGLEYLGLNLPLNYTITILFIITLRIVSIKFDFKLPALK
ncbi:trimeric intracellular cation channel family protein [Nafulsella turpanensis]|uniref:trimeric intracellular cation channel family protein n=1 Tax=Nafulsella turpanensis TaxID=1265690 RepID=UPI000346CA0E|nr:trimeric intracellular cation channel family protein [Nafulsella turpanensis]